MPLMSISGGQAFANLRADRVSLWPDGRKDRVRLSGVARVAFEPGFTLVPGEAIFTAGSCFARNIERRFAELGFEVPACAFTLPAEERASDTENDFLNKYPPHSILNEMRWALDPQARFPEAGLLQLKSNAWHDPHSAPNLKPASLERVMQRREMVSELYRTIPACRVVVITLGLVEAWFDKDCDCYLNGAPPAAAMELFPDRFRLDVLTVDEISQCLEEIHDLLERFGHPEFRMLLTVSPVPMRNTFTGRDAITANSYSKSTLRVAAEMFVHRHPRVDYFPSYEIVTQTLRSSAYIQDNRHVTPQVVETIVDRVVDAYCADGAAEPDVRIHPRHIAREIRIASKLGDFARAAQFYAKLDIKEHYEAAGYTEFRYRFDYGRALLRSGSFPEAQAELSRAVTLDPGSAEATFQLGRALARLQRSLDAAEAFRRATELAPDSADIRLGLAKQLAALGEIEAAEREFLETLRRQPGEPRAQAALEVLKGQSTSEPARTVAHVRS